MKDEEENDDNVKRPNELPAELPDKLFSGNWEEPPYINDAGIFIVESDDEIERIELSADGTYTIVPAGFEAASESYSRACNNMSKYNPILGRHRELPTDTRVHWELNGIKLIIGTYSKEGTSFILMDYGTLQIESADEVALTRVDGIIKSMRVRFQKFTPQNRVESIICSHHLHPVYSIARAFQNGEMIYEEIIETPEQIRKEFEDYVVVKTPPTVNLPWDNSHGSWIQVDYDSSIIGIAGWDWVDEESQIIKVYYTDGEGGIAQIYITEEYCYIYQVATVDIDDDNYTSYSIVKCELVRPNYFNKN